MTVPIHPDKSLGQRLANLGDITAYSRELSSEEEVGVLFPEPPLQKHLHIVVVQSSPSGECCWLIVHV